MTVVNNTGPHGIDNLAPMVDAPRVERGMSFSEAMERVFLPRVGMTHMDAYMAVNDRIPKPVSKDSVAENVRTSVRNHRIAVPNDVLRLSLLLDDVLHVGDSEVRAVGLFRKHRCAAITRALLSGLCDGLDGTFKSGDFPPKSWMADAEAERVSKVQRACRKWFYGGEKVSRNSVTMRLMRASDAVLDGMFSLVPKLRRAVGMAVRASLSSDQNGGLSCLGAGLDEFSKVIGAVEGEVCARGRSATGYYILDRDARKARRKRTHTIQNLVHASSYGHTGTVDWLEVLRGMKATTVRNMVRLGNRWMEDSAMSVRRAFLLMEVGSSPKDRRGSESASRVSDMLSRVPVLLRGHAPDSLVDEVEGLVSGMRSKAEVRGRFDRLVRLVRKAQDGREHTPLEDARRRLGGILGRGSLFNKRETALELSGLLASMDPYDRAVLLLETGNRQCLRRVRNMELPYL